MSNVAAKPVRSQRNNLIAADAHKLAQITNLGTAFTLLTFSGRRLVRAAA
jgi:hypothetical protein